MIHRDSPGRRPVHRGPGDVRHEQPHRGLDIHRIEAEEQVVHAEPHAAGQQALARHAGGERGDVDASSVKVGARTVINWPAAPTLTWNGLAIWGRMPPNTKLSVPSANMPSGSVRRRRSVSVPSLRGGFKIVS
ncbi:hypothetical protein [Burkholderia plantarii]|uniref:hypothetical protein n=1 Tax=Burkholderia plantarii TaxID=41899 RepID=UPI0018DE7BA2|nr:hypothetical protein [Burkholderia plantarii]MBI0325537.1 hypothetical protein [Burkholderia plantarii]